MKDIIRWLLKVEQAAGKAYANALAHFQDDPEFRAFLQSNAEDEAWHYHVVASAADHIRKITPETPVIRIDADLNKKILGTLTEMNDRLMQKDLSPEDFLKAMAATEFSEWNDIFLYVVNHLKENFREFSVVAPKIQSHKRAIELYMEKFPGGFEKMTGLAALPKIWEEKILIIEDDKSVSGLLKAILEGEGHVDTAANGKEGYEKIENKYYKLIISDIDMPVMDGIRLFTIVKNLYPEIGHRYLFVTGDLSPERKTFMEKNRLAFLEKPSTVGNIRQKAMEILLAH
jgi:CheY-like chemotaxis protein